MENKVCDLVCQPHSPNVLLTYLIKCGRATDVREFQCSQFLILLTVPWLWPQRNS